MSTPLPKPKTLLDGLDALERQLYLFEKSRRAALFQRASSDGTIAATANGMVRLVSVKLQPAMVAATPAATLAARVKDVVNAALAAANTATAAAVTTAAAGWAFPGLPAQGQPAPAYAGFATAASTLSAKIAATTPCDPGKSFEDESGTITVVVDGSGRVDTITFGDTTGFVGNLETGIVTAVNGSLGQATDRHDDTASVVSVIGQRSSPFQDLVIYAKGALRIDDSVAVANQAGGGFGAIANAGLTETNIGVTADVGDVLSQARVVVRSHGRVHGALTTAADLVVEDGTEIAGPVTQHALVVLPDLALGTAFTGPVKPAVQLEPDKTGSAGPGYYSDIIVKSRARLALSAGIYRCNTLDIEADAVVTLNAAAGPIYIYVRDNVIYHGRFDDSAGGFPNLFLGYFGTSFIVLESSFNGTFVAPNASFRLATVGAAGHAGAFHGGKDVEVSPNTRVQHHPFAVPYEDLPEIGPPAPPPSTPAVLGFEDVAGWTAAQATLALASSPVSQGASSLAVTNVKGSTDIVSVPFSTAGLVAPTGRVRVDLWIGATQPNPSWIGQLQLFISIPSANVSNVSIGTKELTPLPRKVWSTIDLALPQAVRTALGSPRPDASFKIVLNVNAGSGPYYLDNMRFA